MLQCMFPVKTNSYLRALRRIHTHVKQGTRPSKKTTNIKDVKRYLSVTSIARDGMLVVRCNGPLVPSTELIIVPHSVQT